MHEGLQKVSRMRELVGITRLSVVVAAAIGFGSQASDGAVAADARKLSGVQIKARLVGMQLTDKVHYRLVYDPDGTLRSYSMGAKKAGRWSIEKDDLCLRLGENDDGCYAVTLKGQSVELVPSGLGPPLDGILEPADQN
ncbi:hypothetical protein JJB99_12380 [Bradyrhizobium diazoefficiens]|uniref:hypothetical protein n=1 Tax=Bradyrhizobium diazoefficiens TaxID=1355477 RepID=UPI00190C6B42|nr:hypothetical protein [Bradyrhizobium diazoefficiens]QQO16875.1 hypothetical protein JJB99_12380 [Bradyrhizobium diazoefficiens]